MDYEVPNNCLFCLNPVLPYSIILDGGSCEANNGIETVGEGIGGSGSNNHTIFDIPNFEVLCTYLKVKDVIIQCLQEYDGEMAKGSIFRASSCDTFLCCTCFEMVNKLSGLYKQLKVLEDQISGTTRNIKRVVMSQSRGGITLDSVIGELQLGSSCYSEEDFIRTFESRVRQRAEQSFVWRGTESLAETIIKHSEVEHSLIIQGCQVFQLPAATVTTKGTSLEMALPEKHSLVQFLSTTGENDFDEGLTLIAETTTVDNKQDEDAKITLQSRKLQELAESLMRDEIQSKAEEDTAVKRKEDFQCPHCTTSFGREHSLKIHIANKHPSRRKKLKGEEPILKQSLCQRTEVEIDGRKMFQCPYCLKYYEKVKSLRNHLTRNHIAVFSESKVSPVVTCHMCKSYKAFKTEALLQKHIFSMHTFGPKYKCSKCTKGFNFKQSLKQHEGVEHKGIRYKCSQCEKYFTLEAHLKRHFQLVHKKEGLLKCSYCEKEFVRQCDLNGHIIIHDTNAPKNHICDVCGKEFLTRSGLVDHSKVHREERRYVCSDCPAKYKKHSHLVAHLRKHTGEKPFKCVVCEKAFAVKSTMAAHMKVHQGPKKKRGKKGKGKIEEEGETVQVESVPSQLHSLVEEVTITCS